MIAVRKAGSADAVSHSFAGVESTLTARAGAPAQKQGDPSGAALMTGTLNQATVEYRFHDYYAIARATNMGDGVLLTEEFDSLRSESRHARRLRRGVCFIFQSGKFEA